MDGCGGREGSDSQIPYRGRKGHPECLERGFLQGSEVNTENLLACAQIRVSFVLFLLRSLGRFLKHTTLRDHYPSSLDDLGRDQPHSVLTPSNNSSATAFQLCSPWLAPGHVARLCPRGTVLMKLSLMAPASWTPQNRCAHF